MPSINTYTHQFPMTHGHFSTPPHLEPQNQVDAATNRYECDGAVRLENEKARQSFRLAGSVLWSIGESNS